MDLLRLTTAGSVDDGKSTLIGRLLVDTQSLLEDQYAEITRLSAGTGHLNLALVTDGLRAEREQGITIDVAYRYFSTPRRKFIIADTPGHEQYTRNMVTGASTAQLAVVLIDARVGVARQSRRHGFIASLLRIPHMLVAVNKMDLVGYSEEIFNAIVADHRAFAQHLEVPDIVYVPIAALTGDNVALKSPRMPWYDGPTLLHHLENVSVAPEANVVDFRFPVQTVVGAEPGFRGFAGQVVSGSIRRGEPVLVLPSGCASRAGTPVLISLDDQIDVNRGDMIVRTGNRPTSGNAIDADLCWMADDPMITGRTYLMQHTTRQVKAIVQRVLYRLNVDTLHREQCAELAFNEIGRVEIVTAAPVFFDSYRINKRTGSFILVDPETHATAAAGMIRGPITEAHAGRAAAPAGAVPGATGPVTRARREQRQGHLAAIVWLTGLSGAGKSTIADELDRQLFVRFSQTARLDGDDLRAGLSHDLGFSPEDRAENVRRAGAVARLLFERGAITICSFISPFRKDRAALRASVPEGRFFEIHVDASIETCVARDPKGLYKRAMAAELPEFTGISGPYEAPERPDLVLRTDHAGVDACVASVLALLEAAGIIPPDAAGSGRR